MTTLEQDINKAKEIINEQRKFIKKHSQFERLYPYTNENINSLFNQFNLQDKNCLTILGSGDQTLDMCLNGSYNITAFDINPLTKYYFKLKKAALLANISIEKYLEFFCYYDYFYYYQTNKFSFHPDTFSKICSYLDEDSYKFWCSLYREYHPLQIRNGNSLFLPHELKHNILRQTIGYLNNETNFNILKEKIRNLNFSFINEDINNLPDFLNKQYDFIYLSDIIQYIDKLYPDIITKELIDNKSSQEDINNQNQLYKLQKFKNLILEYAKHLNVNGNIIAGYIFTNLRPNNHVIYNKNSKDIFNEGFKFLEIEAIENIKRKIYYKQNTNLKDQCIIYQKTR